ncbi:MAG: hypothetical protein GX823_01520 [Clostridiales bacterium]|nr:hypothetical protein [Clostridiales bacterium]
MGVLFSGCPGAASLRGTPTLKEKICPECGEIIEIFSTEMQVQCECGFVAYNDDQNCVSWCKYARECVGDEMYELITNRKK